MADYTITETEAVSLTTEYRNTHEGQTRAFKIDKAEIDKIFAEHTSATGIRAYLGEDATGLNLVMVATDAQGNDILDTFYDKTTTCPTNCGNPNVLNGL
ncbi:MAG: hypothetical protein ACJASF_001260 [Vicingaceae bacterium]|jgi:hypothetical protein